MNYESIFDPLSGDSTNAAFLPGRLHASGAGPKHGELRAQRSIFYLSGERGRGYKITLSGEKYQTPVTPGARHQSLGTKSSLTDKFPGVDFLRFYSHWTCRRCSDNDMR